MGGLTENWGTTGLSRILIIRPKTKLIDELKFSWMDTNPITPKSSWNMLAITTSWSSVTFLTVLMLSKALMLSVLLIWKMCERKKSIISKPKTTDHYQNLILQVYLGLLSSKHSHWRLSKPLSKPLEFIPSIQKWFQINKWSQAFWLLPKGPFPSNSHLLFTLLWLPSKKQWLQHQLLHEPLLTQPP